MLGWLPVVAYFVCLETLVPFLRRRELEYLWWIALLLIIYCMYVLWTHPKLLSEAGIGPSSRRLFVKSTDYILGGMTMFLYDPTIKPHLAAIGLSWLWLVSLGILLAWLLVDAVRTSKRTKQLPR